MSVESAIEKLLPAALGFIGVIVGALVAWWLPHRSTRREKSLQIERDVSSAATVCLGRLIKMQMAHRGKQSKIYTDETTHLGGDADRYLEAISRRPELQRSELDTFRDLSRLLIRPVSEVDPGELLESLIRCLRGQIAGPA